MPESEPTKEELLKRIAELEQQAQARKPAALEFRVSDKGGISVYGLGRFPWPWVPGSRGRRPEVDIRPSYQKLEETHSRQPARENRSLFFL